MKQRLVPHNTIREGDHRTGATTRMETDKVEEINENAKIVWRPDAELVQSSNLAGFMRRVGIESADPQGYRQLIALADADPAGFWNQVIEHMDIRFDRPYSRVFDDTEGIEWTKWCVGATGNAVLNCLDRHEGEAHAAKDAVVWEGEDGRKRRWSYAELGAQTSRLAEGLRALGFGPGDVIGVCMPMVPEAAAALLAISKIGGIVLPLFSGFGPAAIASRLNDGRAVGVLTADGTWRRGKRIDMKTTVDLAVKDVPALRHVVVLKNVDGPVPWEAGRDQWWHEICEGRADRAPTTMVDADAPMMVMYTSGTTGKPKGTVHTHCGFIVKLALDMGLCADYKASDRMMWMSDMGWLVGPILIYSTTLLGATMVMAEGAHDYPDAGRFWRLIKENRVSVLGIAPTIVRSFIQAGGAGIDQYDLSSLRITLSTGEAWNEDAWRWMFEKVCARRAPIINYCGGTEVGGAIVTGTVLHPMKPCAFSGPVPCIGADVVDETGRSVEPGGTGELVLRRSSIGLTRGLWHDPERYIESYWSKVPGVWWHGDRAYVDKDGYWFILGRSDDTLKIAGKRTGPSEVEALVSATGMAAEVAAIGVPDVVKGESLVLVVSLMAGVEATPAMQKRLSDAVVAGLGVAFRPAAVLFVPDLPKTRNMKIMRRVVRAVYVGQPPGDLSSLANPEAIDALAASVRAAQGS